MTRRIEFSGGPMDGWQTDVQAVPMDVGTYLIYGLEAGASLGTFYASPSWGEDYESRFMHIYQSPMPSQEVLDAMSHEPLSISYAGIHEVRQLDDTGGCDIIWSEQNDLEAPKG